MTPGAKVAADEAGVAGTCATCGRPLTQLGSNGECLRCLARLAFPYDDQLPERTGAQGRLTPSPLKYAHFEVEISPDGFPAELGSGAMAVTYLARDTNLNSPAALKVIGQKLANNPTARARFLREARAAAQIHHPNVARVIHYGEQDGECFYAMELVRGETLEARVQRDGPMPWNAALEVIEQVTRGLAAAEACGVVHRDIKPSNLMIESDPTGQPIVKIIDYGVAKVMAAQVDLMIESDPSGQVTVKVMNSGDAKMMASHIDAPDQTQGGFIGTPAFASPEQFASAGEVEIDTRSDIYSLGVTLWFLLTGLTPFRGRTLDEIQASRSDELAVKQLKGAQVPPRVIALLKSMLAVDPVSRPQSARELLTAVRSCQEVKRRARFLWIGGSALAIAAITLGFWTVGRARLFPERQISLAVLPFENLSPASEDAFFATGINEAIVGGLARIRAFRVIGSDSTRSYVPGNRDFALIARELGARRLLAGSVQRENGEVRVSIQLIDPSNKIAAWTKRYRYSLSDVFKLQSELMRDVAGQLQTTVTASERRVIDERPTSDQIAYDLYLRAISAPQMYASAADMRQGLTQKVSWLNEAVARDPDFVLAYCELSKTHDEFEKGIANASADERAIDHRALAEVALQKARRLKPDEGKLHLAEAVHFLIANHDNEQARTELELARRTLPNDSEVEQISGRIARDQGRWADAIEAFKKAVSIEPRVTNHLGDLADAYRSLRSFEPADRAVAKLQELEPTDFYYSFWRGELALEARGDIEPLRAALKKAPVPDEEDRNSVLRTHLVFALYSRDPAAVVNTLADWKRPVLLFVGVSYPKAWFEGLAARLRGDDAAARMAFTAARAVIEPLVQAKPGNAPLLGMLAMIDAGLRRKEDAVKEGRRACELMPAEKSAMGATYVRCQLAVVYAWTEESELALALLDDLTKQAATETLLFQPTYGDLKLNPVWDPLRRESKFSALVQRLGPAASH